MVRKTSVFLLSPWCHTRVTQRSLVQGDTGIHTKEPRRGSLHPAAGPSLTPSVQTKRKRCKNILYIYRDDLLKSRDGSRNSRAKTWQGENGEGGLDAVSCFVGKFSVTKINFKNLRGQPRGFLGCVPGKGAPRCCLLRTRGQSRAGET